MPSMEKYVYGNGLISSEKTEGTVENSNTADAKTDSTKTETAGTLTVYHCDLRGSVRTVTDQTGTVTDRYSYSLYGERTHDTGDGDHIFGYCGRDGVITERDGLLYMRARYYSPELKRFISADSVIGNLSSTPSLNRYAYANGNPVTQIDPFGLSAEPGTKKAKKNINWREAVHDALDIAGSITGYGDICDAVNAVLYLTEGDYINAGLSALSIIPGADAFTKTGKASKVLGNGIVESGLKHLDNVADGIKKLVKKADDAIDLEKHLPKKLLKEESEAFAKKADKVADDVVEDAAKAIKSGSKTNELVLKGTEYSPEYIQKLQDTYSIFKNNGYEISEHGLNRILGRINQGKISSIEEVLDVLKNGTRYKDTVNGGIILYKNGISIHIADDGFIKTVIGKAKVKSTWEVVN